MMLGRINQGADHTLVPKNGINVGQVLMPGGPLTGSRGMVTTVWDMLAIAAVGMGMEEPMEPREGMEEQKVLGLGVRNGMCSGRKIHRLMGLQKIQTTAGEKTTTVSGGGMVGLVPLKQAMDGLAAAGLNLRRRQR